ncbi:MAG: hypothetical protein M3R02_20875, partial [Chloroflexota bacterium]|nr:hypothetical protein [Chloroflexota bacterium]
LRKGRFCDSPGSACLLRQLSGQAITPMSVADLAFVGAGEADLLIAAKLGILIASLLADGAGWFLLSRFPATSTEPQSR